MQRQDDRRDDVERPGADQRLQWERPTVQRLRAGSAELAIFPASDALLSS